MSACWAIGVMKWSWITMNSMLSDFIASEVLFVLGSWFNQLPNAP